MGRVRALLARLAGMVFVLAAVLVVAPFAGTHESRVGPGTVAVGFHPAAAGRTTLAVPPLGRVGASTHRGPVELRLELRSLDVAAMVGARGRVDTGALADSVRAALPGAVRAAVLRMFLAAAVVGALAAAVLPRRRWTTIAAGGAGGLVIAGVLMGSAVPGFDTAAFERLTFQGSLDSGTRVLGALTSGQETAVGRRLESLSDRLASLYSSAVTEQVGTSEGETVLLQVSDLHLNPLGLELARRLARSFEVDAVLDTGDTTSFGLPLEGRYAELIGDFGVPYLFVGGNHDSPENRSAIAASPGVTAIDRRVATVGGVRILGFDDPLVTTTRRVEREERERVERDGGKELATVVRRERPDLVAVHNPVILEPVLGQVDAAAAGHRHRFSLTARRDTVVAVAGSAGATGLGSLLSDSDLPYAMSLLRFRGSELVAVDELEVVGTAGDLVVRRHTITDELGRGDDADVVDRDVDEGSDATVPDSTTTSR